MLRPALLVLAFAGSLPLPAAEPAAAPPSLAPAPDPQAAQAARDVAVFAAIADADANRLRAALAAGGNPQAELPPTPEADALRARYPDGPLFYYLHREPGYTALMFAAALGHESAVAALLAAGAKPNQLSRGSQTFALWQAAHGGHIQVMRLLMPPNPEADRYRVLVDLGRQEVFVWDADTVVLTAPISSGKEETPTRTGRFLITDKYRDWTSNIYEARMPFFMRLSCGDFGLHAGAIPGYPASHGCVRLPEEDAQLLFKMLPVGTLVEIR